MESIVIFVHVIAAIGITGLVLIQHGKGADMGASFGSGASQTIFGSVGSGNALTKSTSWLAIVFFATSLTLALFAKQQTAQSIANESLIENEGVLTEAPAEVVEDIPVVIPVESTAADIPQADAPPVDEALRAAAEQAAILVAEQQAAADAAAEPAEAPAAETEAPAEEPAQ